MNRVSFLYHWSINRIYSMAVSAGLCGIICTLGVAMLSIAVMLVISLIPLYLNRGTSDAIGEVYCINNYSLTIGFQIPQYTTTFNDTVTSSTYIFTSAAATFLLSTLGCTISPGSTTMGTASTQESVQVTDQCYYQTISIISPLTPNATVFNSYALSEACYRTLQICNYDPLLTSCILSNCFVVSLTSSSGTASSPLTNYTVVCTANIYYNTRCIDDSVSDHLYDPSSQQTSPCRKQRLNRINTCLNSTVQLSNVPCLISVSSGLVTSTSGSCAQTVTTSNYGIALTGATSTVLTPAAPTATTTTIPATFTSTTFAASDQSAGHVYRISNINSQTYASSQAGALYCGSVTHTQIASNITADISSQNSG